MSTRDGLAEPFDMLSFLEQLGLSKPQAKAYSFLLLHGQTRAGVLAESIGVIRPEIYQILDDLSKKELVTKSLTTPAVYEANDPKQALRDLLTNASTRIAQLSNMLGEALYTLHSSTPTPTEPVGEFKLIPDRGKLEPTLARIIGRARSSYSAVYSKWGLARVTRDSLEGRAIAEAKKRGVTIRMVSEIETLNARAAQVLSKYAEIRSTRDVGFYLALRDEDEAMIGPMLTDGEMKGSGQNVDLWANNKAFALAMRDLFNKIWGGSTPIASTRLSARRAGIIKGT